MKWMSTYIKRINYTRIYAQTHYNQCTAMLSKLTKGRIMLLRQWGVKPSRRTNLGAVGEQEAAYLPHTRAEPALSQPPAPGSRST